MIQPNSQLSPASAPRLDSLLHRLQQARDADGNEFLNRMDQEINDNLLSSAQMEFCQKFVAAFLAVPPHTTS